MLAGWPWNELNSAEVLGAWLSSLPLSQLLLLASHFGFYGSYTLQQAKDSRNRVVKTSNRSDLGVRGEDDKNHAMRQGMHAVTLLRAELMRRDGALKLGPALTQEMLAKLDASMRVLLSEWLLPCTLVANFHVIIKKTKNLAEPASVTQLQQWLEGHEKVSPSLKWSLFHLLHALSQPKKAKSNKKQRTRGASAAAATNASSASASASPAAAAGGHLAFSAQHLCGLLLKEDVHVPVAPTDNQAGRSHDRAQRERGLCIAVS